MPTVKESRLAEWEACENPDWLLSAIDKLRLGDDRLYRLFACRCARQVWHLLTDERSRHAVEVAERYADGKATWEELAAAREAAAAVPRTSWAPAVAAERSEWHAAWAAWAASRAEWAELAQCAAHSAEQAAAWEANAVARTKSRKVALAAQSDAWDAARAAQCNEIRGLWPNPFRREDGR